MLGWVFVFPGTLSGRVVRAVPAALGTLIVPRGRVVFAARLGELVHQGQRGA